MRKKFAAFAVCAFAFSASSCGSQSIQNAGPAAGAIPNGVIVSHALSAPYGAGSISDFANSRFVRGVVTGEVVDTSVVVYDDADVYTEVAIRVATPKPLAGTIIVTRESGGTVALERVRSDFEARFSAEVLDANADQLITYQSEEMPPISQPGDQILAMIAGDPSDPGGVFTAAKMIRDSDGKFRWESTAPNDAWAPEVGGKAVANLVSAKAASSTRLLKPGGN